MTLKSQGCVVKSYTFLNKTKVKNFNWIHIDSTNKESKEYLQTNFNKLDGFIIKKLLSNELKPRVIEYNEGLLLTLKLINLNETEEIINIPSIKMWVEKNLIISVQSCELQVIADIIENIEIGKQGDNIENFVNIFINHMLNNMNRSLITLDEKVSKLERILMIKKKPISNGIYKARQQLLLLEKHIVPQRETIYSLLQNPYFLKTTILLKETYNQLNIYTDDVEDIRQNISLLIEENNTISSNKLHNSIHILSIISVALLPLHNIIHFFSDSGEIWVSLIILFLIAYHIIKLKYKQ